MTEVFLPIRTWSEANLREHWAKRARRVRKQRQAARLLVRAAGNMADTSVLSGPITRTLTRIAPRTLESDNLAGSLKAVRDGVADALGVDDGCSRIEWRYDQRKGKPHEYAVLVEIQ